MSSRDRLNTLVMCSGQLLALTIQSNLILRNKIIKKIAFLLVSLPTQKKFASPYTSLDLVVQIFLSDRLWAPLFLINWA